MSLEGIDVSEHQGDINWRRVRSAGKRFAFIRVHNGWRADHLATAARVNSARSAGLKIGAYAYVVPGNGATARQQFDEFYAKCKSIGITRRGDLRFVIDVEESHYDLSTRRGRFLTRLFVRRWVKRCFDVTGHHPIIYTGKWFWTDQARFTNDYGCRLWLAAYVQPSALKRFIPTGFDHIAIWQYSGLGHCDGISGDVDLDRYLSSYTDLMKYHTFKHGV